MQGRQQQTTTEIDNDDDVNGTEIGLTDLLARFYVTFTV